MPRIHRVLSRRRLLRGVLGGVQVAVGLPCLQAMLDNTGQAYAADAKPLQKRMGIFFFGTGAHREWTPAAVGPLTLPVGLLPLERHKKYVTLVSGLNFASFGNFSANRHFMGASSVLSGTPPVGERVGGVTLDQLVAGHLKGGVRASLEVSVTDGGSISYGAANSPNAPISDPRKLMERVFGGAPGAMASPAASNERKLRALYLDAVRQDTDALKVRLGSHDRRRLDGYLEGIREIEKQVSALPMPAAMGGAACGPAADALKGISDDSVRNRGNNFGAINLAQAKVLAAALACGHTQVFTFNFSSPNSTPFFRLNPGLANNHHELGHQMHADLPKSVAYIMERLAELLDALASFPEADGKTLLDQTGILVTSEVARNHEEGNMPTLLVGGAGGALKGGQHIKASGPTTRAGLTLARAVGAPLTSYGVRDAAATEVLRDALV